MKKIVVVVGSTRIGRQTPKAVAMVVRNINTLFGGKYEVEVVDLIDYSIPFLTEKYANIENPCDDLKKFRKKLLESNALIVVSPEYNGSCPGVLKNCLDYFKGEYENKLVGIVTVSSGHNGGKGCFNTIKFLFGLLKANVVEKHLQINNINESIDIQGNDVKNAFVGDTQEFLNLLNDKI